MQALESALTTQIPLWQAVLLGGTTFITGRLLKRHILARALHTTSTAAGSKRPKGKKGLEMPSLAIGEDIKMVLVIRTDLGMSKGKVAAQCSHAALACYRQARRKEPALLKAWEMMGETKVTVRCTSEEELLQLQGRAQNAGLVAQSIRDAGRTQIAAGSRTVLGIGPGPTSLIDRVSGNLQLY
ncbi:hypothetical protein GGF46_004279 [Coemansia sp. RSA 552]|nr:hypothetical protein GGF46_004279 [Coemansia sp. RSA 552]